MTDSEQGIEVAVSVSLPSGMNSLNPMERMEAMQGLQSRLRVTLTDSNGHTHEPSSGGSGGSSSSGRVEMMSSRWSFPLVPASAKAKTVTCTVTDRTGQPVRVPFRLTVVPLPGAGQ